MNQTNIRKYKTSNRMIYIHIVFSIFILSSSILVTTAYAASDTVGNYTAVLTIGQTPYQLGPLFKGTTMYPGGNGWSWWDVDRYGYDKQKNLIALMVLDNTTGTIKPVTGLATPPTWPQASYKKYAGNYSYKAATNPTLITTLINYVNNMNILMAKEVNLTGVADASLTFWEWYNIDGGWDFGYIMVSTDGGNSWTNLPGTRTSNQYLADNNLGNGITGISSGWIQETMNLTSYVGNKILLGFRFQSDDSYVYEGWYIDDIRVTSGATTIFSDDAETIPVIKTLSVNVTYPSLTITGATDPLTSSAMLTYTGEKQQVNLSEDVTHPGTYFGYFEYNPFVKQYSGNYNVTFMLNNTPITAQFQTTILGCQQCHNKKESGAETSYIHGESNGGGMQSCMRQCHGSTRRVSTWVGTSTLLKANPIHVHEMQYGHVGGFLYGAAYTITPYTVPSHVTVATCEQCHTSFVHNNVGTDTAKIASYTLYGTNISFSSGTHKNLTCERCHNTLSYPTIPQNQYQLERTLGYYKPRFTSYESFTDTYIIAVNGTQNIDITVTATTGKTENVQLYLIGPIDNTTKGLQGIGKSDKNLTTPININFPSPNAGTWLFELRQRDQLGGKVNYTISSNNYTIQEKPIIKIPECNTCHNSSTTGGAYTQFEIPDWNSGFAHADTNNDSILDVQCRACHDAMHNITTNNCRTCHATAPNGHPIAEPTYSQYTTSQCLACHGDPHRVTGGGGGSCIGCHENDVNISKFERHADINISDGSGVVSDNDCMTCHHDKDMNNNSIHLCEDCHINADGVVPVNDSALIIEDFYHGQQTCKNCHAPFKYHMNGTVGPKGLMDLFSFN